MDDLNYSVVDNSILILDSDCDDFSLKIKQGNVIDSLDIRHGSAVDYIENYGEESIMLYDRLNKEIDSLDNTVKIKANFVSIIVYSLREGDSYQLSKCDVINFSEKLSKISIYNKYGRLLFELNGKESETSENMHFDDVMLRSGPVMRAPPWFKDALLNYSINNPLLAISNV